VPKWCFPTLPQGSAPPPQTFFQGPPGVPKSRKNALKRARCPGCAHGRPQSGHWGAPGTPRCSTRRQKVPKSAHLKHPGWHKPSKNGVLQWENTHFRKINKSTLFTTFDATCAAGGRKSSAKGGQGETAGAPGGATWTPRVPKGMQKGDQK